MYPQAFRFYFGKTAKSAKSFVFSGFFGLFCIRLLEVVGFAPLNRIISIGFVLNPFLDLSRAFFGIVRINYCNSFCTFSVYKI